MPGRWSLVGDEAHGGHEPVAPARQRLDIGGCVACIAKRFAQAGDYAVEAVVEGDKRASGPYACPQLVVRHQLSGAFEQEQEREQRLLLKTHAAQIPKQLARSRIELEGSKPIPRSRWCRHRRMVAQDSG